ncbi:MAG: saccharopine dehydrogenase NADP-binding domain-containing protein [Lysobacteraceae bacterium]
MPLTEVLTRFHGRLLMVGFGCIGRAVLSLLLRHTSLGPDRIRILTDKDSHRDVAEEYLVGLRAEKVTPENFRHLLGEELCPGDFLLNLSIGVSSLELIAWCREAGVIYLDACIEPWEGGYYDTKQALLDIVQATRGRGRRAEGPRRLGGPRAPVGRQGEPRRRARHAGVGHGQMPRRVREYPERGRLRRRGLPAGGAGLSWGTHERHFLADVLGGVVWAMRHPDRGIVDPDEMDFREVLDATLPYLGEMVGKFTSWTPLEYRGVLLPEDVDRDDPWQFKNVRVT